MKIRISIIDYSNTIPFVYGLHASQYIQKHSTFLYHYPSQGVELLQNNTVDISIIPVASIPQITHANILSNYCIGTNKQVASVKLFSKIPIQQVSHIVLDYQSRSSNMLTKLLANEFWKISPTYTIGNSGYEFDSSIQTKVIIGDRAMDRYVDYEYSYDLAEEWYTAFSLPFVFACWVSNKPISTEYLQEFDSALQFGTTHINQAIEFCNKQVSFDLHTYLHTNIEYILTQQMKDAMQLYLNKISKLI